MKIIINHNENISPEESVEFASILLNNKGLSKIIEECKPRHDHTGPIYARSRQGGTTTLCWAKLNKASLTFQVNREYN